MESNITGYGIFGRYIVILQSWSLKMNSIKGI